MRPRVAVAAAGAMVVVAALGACSKNTGSNEGSGTTVQKNTGGISTNAKDSQGPAPAVAGAKKGGDLQILQDSDFEHLDPQRTYVVQAMSAEQMFARTLTMFRQDKGGKLTLVGDLATGPGKDLDGNKCMNWEYTLKDGLKYEDGSTITATDVAYGISRSYSSQIAEGPHYLAQWLSNDAEYNKTYKGPYNGGAAIAPGLEVKGNNTLIFHFKAPHCDLPFALQLPTSAPVPKAKDTGAKYDNKPFSSGPYKVKQYIRGTKLVLERNKYWDPKSDPIRHDYPNTITYTFGPTDVTQTNRLVADSGADQYAVGQQNVPQTLLPKVTGDSSLTSRTISGPAPFVYYAAVNTQHIKDLKTRQAIAYAIDRKAVIQTLGGSKLADPAYTLLSPTVLGQKDYKAYDGGPSGNAAKAKELLGGKKPEIVFGYRNNPWGQRLAPAMQQALEKAGFKVVLKPVDAENYFTELGRKANAFDLYVTDWAADWPTGAAVMPVLTDGRTIQANGNNVVSYYNDPAYNKKLDAAGNVPAAEAGPKWAALDKEWAQNATTIPIYYSKSLSLTGSKVGGVELSTDLGTNVYTSTYLK
ncbi:MAG TPA: ABC transporter substrate-binding protein [Actinocatenispora sp.]